MRNLVAIDYGRKHCGLAIALTPIAEPYKTVVTNRVFQEVEKLFKKYDMHACVVGLSENQMAAETRAFSQKLANHFQVQVYFTDETLSSYETRKRLAKSGMKRKKREAKLDHYVAAAFLQEFLETFPSLAEVPETATMKPESKHV